MAEARLASVLGLGFGDCGKGHFTDFLARGWRAHTVVRFNGGGQAGHNVVLPDGRHHTFSQFGSATFQPGVVTVLARPVVVHPTALLLEAEHLRGCGVPDALARLCIDPHCRITTPFHQALGRLRELERGAKAHGTCGAGFGETVRHDLEFPAETLHMGDLSRPSLARKKVADLQCSLREAIAQKPLPEAADFERQILFDPSVGERWLEQALRLPDLISPMSENPLADRLHRPGTVVFEGAQGILLDEWHGFHPHTTWSSTTPEAVEALAREAGHSARVRHFGVLRSYLTRHGPGPLPTEDPGLDQLAEPHNSHDGWQGRFRRGHPDALLLKYALAVTGSLDGLLISHLDALSPERPLKWCEGYHAATQVEDPTLCVRDEAGLVRALRPPTARNLDHQSGLTCLLQAATPHFEKSVASSDALIERIEAVASTPVVLASRGPGPDSIRQVRGLPI